MKSNKRETSFRSRGICLLALLSLLYVCCSETTAEVSATFRQRQQDKHVFNRHLITSVKSLDCDPCIDRRLTRLVAILPEGTSAVISSAMEQSALNMNVQLRILTASETQSMARILQDEYKADPTVNAWIVNLADQHMEDAVRTLQQQDEHVVVFGWGWGYQSDVAKAAAGWMASDDTQGGRTAATEFYTTSISKNESLTSVAFVMDSQDVEGPALVRQVAFEEQLLDLINEEQEDQVSLETVAITTKQAAFRMLTPLFRNCPKQAILFHSTESIELALELKAEYGCSSTMIAVFLDDYHTDLNSQVYRAITREEIDFALNPKIHLQTSMPVLLAAVFASTGKVPSMPLDVPTYWTGPELITKRNVLSDTTAACEQNAFPVCTTTGDQNVLAKENNDMSEVGDEEHECPCTERKSIRIGGVLHGRRGGFWDPVYATAEQAALDMDIELDLEAFEPDMEFELINEKMAARIRNLCDSGVHGLFVTIPSPNVAEAIQRCLDLSIPVVSVNSGTRESQELGLAHHIGQNEYAGGYGAAQRLIEAGMKRGYCLDHQFGHLALAERCQGFKDAISATEGVEFIEHVPVPPDNDAQFLVTIEDTVAETGDWEGIGFLQLDATMFPILRKALEGHPAALAGVFDLASHIYDDLEKDTLQFAIDQQPFLQGNLPVYLLTYMASTQQRLTNQLVQSGPSFVQDAPTDAQKVCEANFFAVCPDRPEEDMSYISSSLLALGYALFGMLALLCLLASAWVYLCRETRVVKVSQPLFLHLTVLGAVISSCSILFMGSQTSYRLDRDTIGNFVDKDNPDLRFVDASCMAVPWLYGMGFAVTFSALFAKIYRVKLMFQSGVALRRKPVTIQNVVPVMATMLFAEIVLLASWQIVAPLRWVREVIDEIDGFATESVGSCEAGTQGWTFYIALAAFHVLCLFYALVLCYQTRHLSSDFAESSYVSLAVAFMFQVLLLVVPISALVHDNADVFYFIRVASIFFQNVSVLILIFVPKVLRMRDEDLGSATKSAPSASKPAEHLDEADGAPHLNANLGSGRSAMKTRSTSEVADSWAAMSVSDAESAEQSTPLESAVSKSTLRLGQKKQKKRPVREFVDSWAGLNVSDVESSPESSDNPSESNRSDGLDIIAEGSESEDVQEPSPLLSPDEALSDWETLGFSTPEFARQVVDLLNRSTNFETRRTISEDIVGNRASGSPFADTEALLSSEEVLSKWEELGFTTKDFAERVIELLRPSTDSATREKIAANLEGGLYHEKLHPVEGSVSIVDSSEAKTSCREDLPRRSTTKPDEELREYLKKEIQHACEVNYSM